MWERAAPRVRGSSVGAGGEGEECENDAYRYLRVRNDC